MVVVVVYSPIDDVVIVPFVVLAEAWRLELLLLFIDSLFSRKRASSKFKEMFLKGQGRRAVGLEQTKARKRE